MSRACGDFASCLRAWTSTARCCSTGRRCRTPEDWWPRGRPYLEGPAPATCAWRDLTRRLQPTPEMLAHALRRGVGVALGQCLHDGAVLRPYFLATPA